MNYQDNLNRAIELANKASDLDNKAMKDDTATPGTGNWAEVLHAYELALKNWLFVIKYEKNPGMKQQLSDQAIAYMNRAEAIKSAIKKKDEEPPAPTSPASVDRQGSSGQAATMAKPKTESKEAKDKDPGVDSELEKLKKQLEGSIVSDKPNVRWHEIAGLEQAKSLLQETVLLPAKFPELFQGKRQPWKGILLYGPPGTGKSQLAKAVATEVDSTFFSLSSSDVVSKWQGESEKMVKGLFQLARASTPAVIFIDEIDSLCGARGDGEAESSRRIKTEFLVQMDGVGNDTTGVLMLGATNCPWDIDSAIRRRFQRRIYIPLPDIVGRRAMVDIGIGNTAGVFLTEDEKMVIATRTEGLSGADIGIMCKEALMEPIKKCQKASKFKKIMGQDGRELYTPCSPVDPAGIVMSVFEVPANSLQEPPVNIEDFMTALDRCKPSVGQAEIDKNDDWTRQFGQEGA